MTTSERFKTGIHRGIAALTKAIFPVKCLICLSLYHSDIDGNEMVYGQKFRFQDMNREAFAGVMAPFLCHICAADFTPIESPICPQCGMMFESRVGENHFCASCITERPAFDKTRALGVYDGALMSVIHAFKYGGKIQLGRPLGMLLLGTFLAHWEAGEVDLVIPVPLHPKKLRARGFNQALMLVKTWPDMLKPSDRAEQRLEIGHEMVWREKWTRPQTGLNKEERRRNMKNAFRVKDVSGIRKKRILLVDDVYTTGATIDECATVLKRAGAEKIDVLTLARV